MSVLFHVTLDTFRDLPPRVETVRLGRYRAQSCVEAIDRAAAQTGEDAQLLSVTGIEFPAPTTRELELAALILDMTEKFQQPLSISFSLVRMGYFRVDQFDLAVECVAQHFRL